MAKEYEVNGKATIQTGTTVTTLALEDLGVSIDGITVATEVIRVPIHTDEFGGPEGVPADFQYLGEFAHIRAELIFWENDVFNKIWGHKFATAAPQASVGVTGAIGAVLGALTTGQNGYHRLAILAPNATTTRGFDWPRAYLKSSPRKIGTRVTRIQCEWYAWQQASDSGTTWMDRNPT